MKASSYRDFRRASRSPTACPWRSWGRAFARDRRSACADRAPAARGRVAALLLLGDSSVEAAGVVAVVAGRPPEGVCDGKAHEQTGGTVGDREALRRAGRCLSVADEEGLRDLRRQLGECLADA